LNIKSIVLLSLIGQEVIDFTSTQRSGNKFTFDVSGLKSGFYYLRIDANQEVKNYKVLKVE